MIINALVTNIWSSSSFVLLFLVFSFSNREKTMWKNKNIKVIKPIAAAITSK